MRLPGDDGSARQCQRDVDRQQRNPVLHKRLEAFAAGVLVEDFPCPNGAQKTEKNA